MKTLVPYRMMGIAASEALLAAAMVASFGVFVVASVPWSDVLGRGESVVVEGFEAIEKANYAFFNEYRMWPHQLTDGEETKNITALLSPESLRYPYSMRTHFKNFLPKFNSNATVLKHNLGEGGVITQKPVRVDGGFFMEITYENVPLRVARRIDEKIDGFYDPDHGRVYFSFKDDGSMNVNIHYIANQLS